MDLGSAVGLVKACYQIGVKIIDICSTWKHANSEVTERVLIVGNCWNCTQVQVNFVMRMRTRSIMSEDHCRVMDGLLKQLELTLSHATTQLEAVIQKSSSARPGVFGFGFKVKKPAGVWKKDTLDVIISELEKWQHRFDPSWFLFMKIVDPVIDEELNLAKATEERLHGLATATKPPLALAAGLRNVLSPSAQRTPIFLQEAPMEWKGILFSDAKGDVRVLAAKLSQADPLTFGLLNCKGVVQVKRPGASFTSPPQWGSKLTPPTSPPHARSPSPNNPIYSHFQIFFQIPHGIEALKSLREMLLRPDEHMSLSWKMLMARELGKAVNYVHTFAFVHKNIRPESVLCFEDPRGAHSHAFLVGFDAFRAAEAGTVMGGDMTWARNVYRHPNRQGLDPSEKYTMQHDIYSLGVCLLEIGLWASFVEYTNESEFPGPPQAKFGKFFYEFENWRKGKGGGALIPVVVFQLKDYLVQLAQTRLSPRMGDKYAQIVVSCLMCLDDDNEDFGSGVESDDFIAMQFIERILKTLHTISL
ncbi:hypothetical protein N7540_000216 [Penicillium herquei]|nr:hypothetical protein N7540_000216 [Penicillium herquei]